MALANPYNYKKPQGYVSGGGSRNLKKDKPSIVVSKTADNNDKSLMYQEQKILSAEPEELTLMLYDGVVKFLKQAKLYLEMKDMNKTHYALIRSQDIIVELQATLVMDYEISQNLNGIYDFLLNHIKDANIKKDVTYIDEALEIAVEIRDTWQLAIAKLKGK